MDNLFLVLLLLSIAGLIVGLTNPRWIKMPSRRMVGGVFGGAAALFFILFGVTSPSTSQPVTASSASAAPVANNTDLTTNDVYTTVAGQTVYPLKNRYTGDFYIMLDGKSLATGDDGTDDPKQYQALYNDSGPFLRLVEDPGAGHILEVYETFTPPVDASKLAADYNANQIAADAKYKGQTIKISGTVDTIGKDILDTPFITFAPDDPYSVTNLVQCMFSKDDEQQLVAVSKGQDITLEGTVKGSLGNILVEDCTIVN